MKRLRQTGCGRVRGGGAGQCRGRCRDRAPELSAPGGAQKNGGAGRQRHLLRHRRTQPEARALHARHARGHERLRRGARHTARRDAGEAAVTSTAGWRSRRTTSARAPTSRTTSSPRLNGTTIEIVHTDAEGRMVLADTLTLAARAKPDLIVDFATLTGSMHTALGDRYSGIFATSEGWRAPRSRRERQRRARVRVSSTTTTMRRSTAVSPTSSSAPWRAAPITYSPRVSCKRFTDKRPGYTWISRARAARAGWVRWHRGHRLRRGVGYGVAAQPYRALSIVAAPFIAIGRGAQGAGSQPPLGVGQSEYNL